MTEDQSESDVTSEVNGVTTSESDVTKATKTTRLNVTDIEWLQEEAVGSESPAATLGRLRQELLNHRDNQATYKHAIDEYTVLISQLETDLETLRSGSSTAVTSTAGQSTFGDFGGDAIKETLDAVKEVCEDETVCIKTAVHLVDTKAAMVSKQLDRDHSADQKQLDREDKEKDRQLKLELAEKKAQHDKDMALIKRGVVKDEDLEGVTFLGSMEKRKTAKKRLADMKNRAYHAANGEEEEFGDPEGEHSGDGAEVDDVDPPEHEDPDHAR